MIQCEFLAKKNWPTNTPKCAKTHTIQKNGTFFCFCFLSFFIGVFEGEGAGLGRGLSHFGPCTFPGATQIFAQNHGRAWHK